MVMEQKELERRPMPRSGRPRKSKRISVSSKRQISIPKEFYEQLNIGEEVTLELYGNYLILKPVRDNFDDFSDQILEDLVAEGYSGRELLAEFKHRKGQIGNAVESLISESAQTEVTTIDHLFGDTNNE